MIDVLTDPLVAEQTPAIGELVAVLTGTLPERGMDRMTSERIEEFMSITALTAHI